jgi:hypothetical protein
VKVLGKNLPALLSTINVWKKNRHLSHRRLTPGKKTATSLIDDESPGKKFAGTFIDD